MKKWINIFLLVFSTLTTSFAENALKPDAQFKGEFIYLRDYGTDDIAYLALPQEEPKAGIVLIPDGHGIDAWMKITSEVIAQKGYIVLALDLYNGIATADDQQALRMESDLMEKGVLAALKTSTVFFQQSPRFKMDKVFVVGMGSMQHHLLTFAGQKNLSFNGVVVVNPSKLPDPSELKAVRYPVQFQVSANSPLTADLTRMIQEAGAQDILEVQANPQLKDNVRRLDENQWRQIDEFIRKNSTEARKQSILSRIF